MSEQLEPNVTDQPATESNDELANNEEVNTKRRWRISRRGLLIGAGIAGAGLALGVTLGGPYARLKIAEMVDNPEGMPSNLTDDPFAWFEVLEDGRIRLYLTKVEMGQGVHTALTQIAAEEVGVDWEDIEVAQATTAVGPADSSGTFGSASVATVYKPLRQAAATLRVMLQAEAARQLGVAEDDLTLDGRSFVAGANEISLYEVANAGVEWEVPERLPLLKSVGEFEVIGRSLPRVDIPTKVTGQAQYGYDMKLENMKYGAVARPPTIAATLKSAAEGDAAQAAGVHTVLVADDFAGVVADTRTQAHAGAARLEMEWDEGKLWQQEEIDAIVVAGGSGGITIQSEGDAGRALASNTSLSAEYRSPFAVQASLEPQAALADVRPEHVRVWASTQTHNGIRPDIAEALGVAEEIVEVIPTYLGGGFGRKADPQVAIEAARLSQAAGIPVHVGWTRTEEMRYGYFRPPTHSILAASLNEAGQIEAMEHQQASGDVAFGFFPPALAAVMGADFGAYRGSLIRYAIPNRHTIAYRRDLPVRTGWWRGLGLLANIFAVESFMDELAHSAGADPLQFRLDHLSDEPADRRMAAVLEAAASTAGWGGSLPEGHALGIACCSDVDTVVAQVAEVSLDEQSGQVRVHRVSVAMDPGLVVNPDGARAQVEGNVMWGIGSTLIEEMRVVDGQVSIDNFDNYPLLTMAGAPHVDTLLLEAGDGRPRGVGEPPIGPVGAAIGNALFTLTGVRFRELPLTPERVLAALS